MFTIPKRLRLYFHDDRGLLGELARAAWETVVEVYCGVLGRDDPALSVQPGTSGPPDGRRAPADPAQADAYFQQLRPVPDAYRRYVPDASRVERLPGKKTGRRGERETGGAERAERLRAEKCAEAAGAAKTCFCHPFFSQALRHGRSQDDSVGGASDNVLREMGLKKLNAAGCTSPIGLQCYGLKGDSLVHLRQAIAP